MWEQSEHMTLCPHGLSLTFISWSHRQHSMSSLLASLEAESLSSVFNTLSGQQNWYHYVGIVPLQTHASHMVVACFHSLSHQVRMAGPMACPNHSLGVWNFLREFYRGKPFLDHSHCQ